MKTEVVKFAGAELMAVTDGSKILVAMKPICDVLGMEWPRQIRILQADTDLSSVIAKMATTGADGKKYDMVCLPLDYLNGWLQNQRPATRASVRL